MRDDREIDQLTESITIILLLRRLREASRNFPGVIRNSLDCTYYAPNARSNLLVSVVVCKGSLRMHARLRVRQF